MVQRRPSVEVARRYLVTNEDICTELSGAKNQLVTMIRGPGFGLVNFLKHHLCHLFNFVSTNQLLAVIEISDGEAGVGAKKYIHNRVTALDTAA